MPHLLGFRRPTAWQYDQSRELKKKLDESNKLYFRLYQKQRNFDMMATLLANFGLVLAMYSYELVTFEYVAPPQYVESGMKKISVFRGNICIFPIG